jgi:imidazolonepropionase-like amidohydrolase
VGKDADIVLADGSPFEISTRVLRVLIDGNTVYQA